jgi:uncharacterized protein
MPTNVTPEYRAAEQRYRSATLPDEQMAALQEMLSTVPKHKGTEKLQADIKRRISQLRKEALQQRRSGHRPFFHIERAEGGQTVLVGAPNAGKSLLVSRMTNATPEVADYAYTTQAPLPGMMTYEDVQLQVVDMPPVAAEGTEYWVFEIVKHSDLVLFVVDAADDDVLSHVESVESALERRQVELVSAESDDPGLGRRALLVANKLDLPGAAENVAVLADLLAPRFPVIAVSAQTGQGLVDLRRAVFDHLRLIRVYTKPPGQAVRRTRPFVLPRGSTLHDAAMMVHHYFAEKLKFARIWGAGRFDGQMVGREDELHDNDLVEFHI